MQHPIEYLPNDALLFLLVSRYCETDRLSAIAWSMFGQVIGWARVQAICDLCTSMSASVTIMPVLAGQRGRPSTNASASAVILRIWRLHFVVAPNIPARYCTGYLGDICVPADPNPMDFSGWFEAYLDNQWHVFGVSALKPDTHNLLLQQKGPI